MGDSTSVVVEPAAASFKIPSVLGSAASLANLLPTGTHIAFETLSSPLTNNGYCHTSNKYLTAILLCLCSLSCWFFSFTDSFIGLDGQVYYGIATFSDFYVFNYDYDNVNQVNIGLDRLNTYRLRTLDFIHAILTSLMFLALAFTDFEVHNCFFSGDGVNGQELVGNLPLVIGVFATLAFVILPTTRKGIGFSDSAPSRLE